MEKEKVVHTQESIIEGTHEHREDVAKLFEALIDEIIIRVLAHDNDKLVSSNAKILADALNNRDFTKWSKTHMETQRHHNEWIVSNVYNGKTNLIDLLEMIVDSVAANKRRSGKKPEFVDEYLFFVSKGYDKQLATILANTFIQFYDKYEIE